MRSSSFGHGLTRHEDSPVPPRSKPSPNRPHPSLEYPALYFALKKWPRIQEKLRRFYDVRWRMSYPLQKNLPWSSKLRKLKIHLTYGELMLILPFWIAVVFILAKTFIEPSVSATGRVARTALIGCFVFAQRNSFVTLILGMPVDRTIFYHKLSARVALLGTLGHAWAFFVDPKFQDGAKSFWTKLISAFDGTMRTAGSMMFIMMIGILVTALPIIRRRLFECFYYVHVTLVFGTVCGAFFHTGVLVPFLVCCTWGVDVFLRSIVMARSRYPRKATVKILSSTVVELSFPKVEGFDYNPGQYVYIALPDISMLQWHPFSLSSSPQMRSVTLHIRKAGDWTSRLYELAKKQSEVDFLCEGPYGSLGVNLHNDRYKMVMLVSGGIGITPMQSICDQLLFEQARGQRQLKKLSFIWSDRDPVMMREAPVVRRSSSIVFSTSLESAETSSSTDEGVEEPSNFFARPLSIVSPGQSDVEDETFYDGIDALMELDADVIDRLYVIDECHTDTFDTEEMDADSEEGPTDVKATSTLQTTVNESQEDSRAGAFDANDIDQYHIEECYADTFSADEEDHPMQTSHLAKLTIHSGNEDDDTVVNDEEPWGSDHSTALGEILDLQLYLTGENSHLVPNVPGAVKGRPHIKDIFVRMKIEALTKGERRLAVCVCAPQKLSNLCRKACIIYSDDLVRFDFHAESMGA